MKSQFGKLKVAYDASRQGYGTEVYTHLLSLLDKNSKILDLGCGTGISTRELSKNFENVTGADNDKEMLLVAKSYNNDIDYILAPAEKLPFENGSFDAIATFGAFHWFTDEKSIIEIKRILKPGGLLVVVNKKDKNFVRSYYNEVVGKVVGEQTSMKVKSGYNPSETMRNNGFHNITSINFSKIEKFTIKEVLLQVQSWNAWSYVPNDKKESTLQELKDLYKQHSKDGIVERVLDVIVVTGTK